MTVANPHETIEPSSTYEALQDTTRFLGTLRPRDEVVKFIAELDPIRIINTVKGQFLEPPASSFELVVATTVGHYASMFGDRPLGAVTMLAVLQQEVRDGGVFVGEPLPASHFAQG